MSGFTEMERKTLMSVELSYIRDKKNEATGNYFLRFDFDQESICQIGVVKDEATAIKMAHYIIDSILTFDPTAIAAADSESTND